jgi:phosphatidylinositol-3-phosphatase
MSLGSVHYQHVVWIWMENRSFGDIVGSSQAPYLNDLAGECGLATNYHNLTHPSLPNYVGATSGLLLSSLSQFLTDCNPSRRCSTRAASIFSQGETWKAYEESMPSDCDKKNPGDYAVRHNPPPYFSTLSFCKPKRLVRHGAKISFDVPYTQLSSDLAADTLPAFSFVTPNLIDDMHDGTVADGDSWLATHLPTILDSSEYSAGHVAVFITWDEGEPESNVGENCVADPAGTGCLVPTIVVSPSTPVGTTSGAFYDHYSLLRTTEELLGLPLLGQAATAASLAPGFNL